MRPDGRRRGALRPVTITRRFIKHAEGSALIALGETKVICTATVEEQVPRFLRDQGKGWVTAEYAMLPRATKERTPREVNRGRPGGRTHEIQRLIGRSLRAVVDTAALGPRTIWLDCDVLQADGGTRTAAVTGAFVALADAVAGLKAKGAVPKDARPIRDYLAAVSVGLVGGEIRLDLAYIEDAAAEVDLNLVMTGSGTLVEIQATAERRPFTEAELREFVAVGWGGIHRLIRLEQKLLGPLDGPAPPDKVLRPPRAKA